MLHAQRNCICKTTYMMQLESNEAYSWCGWYGFNLLTLVLQLYEKFLQIIWKKIHFINPAFDYNRSSPLHKTTKIHHNSFHALRFSLPRILHSLNHVLKFFCRISLLHQGWAKLSSQGRTLAYSRLSNRFLSTDRTGTKLLSLRIF